MNRFTSIILLVVTICMSICAQAQNHYNKIIDLYGKGFNRCIHSYEEGKLISVAVGDEGEPNNVLITMLDSLGNLVWTEILAHDSLPLFVSRHSSSFIEDEYLYVTGVGQYLAPGIFINSPYLLKYNLYTQTLVFQEHYPFMGYGIRPQSAVHHSDNFIYSAGIEYIDEFDSQYWDLNLMKYTTSGELIWSKTIDHELRDRGGAIFSYSDRLYIMSSHATTDSYTLISEIDTSGSLLNSSEPFFIGSTNAFMDIRDSVIYYFSMSDEDITPPNKHYIVAYDLDLNLLWEKYIDNSDLFGLRLRHAKALEDELIVLGNIQDVHTLGPWKEWSYAASYSIEDGSMNWEQVLFIDSNHIHHLDDMIQAENGDLILMGTYFSDIQDPDYDQYLWLLRTDSLGCSIDKDVCYDTFEEYFESYQTVAVEDVYYQEALSMYPNPIKNHLNIESTLGYNLVYRILDLNGQVMHSGHMSASKLINTSDWPSGIYMLQYVNDSGVMLTRKLIRGK